MSLIKKKKTSKEIRRSTSAPHNHTAAVSFTTTTTPASSGLSRTPSSSDEEAVAAEGLPSHFFRSMKASGKGKSQTWSPDEPSRSSPHPQSLSGEVKTTASSPSRARRASKMFRMIGGGSRIGASTSSSSSTLLSSSAHHSPSAFDFSSSSTSSPTTPPLWLPLVDFLCRNVEQHGVGKMGIFRLSANARTVRELLHACVGLYEKRASEEAMHRLFVPYTGEVDVAASVLKAYLREQSQPLIPTTYHDRFVSVAGSDQLDERIEQLAQHAYALPGELRAILERLTRSLHVIQANQEVNRMDASNLAIETEGLDIMKIRSQCQVIETFILHHNRIFTQDMDETMRELSITEVVAGVIEEVDEKRERGTTMSIELDSCAGTELKMAPPETELAVEHRWRKEHLGPFSSLSCHYCHKAIFGIRHKAFLCQGCHIPAHSKCRKRVGSTCDGGSAPKATEHAGDSSSPVIVVVEGSWSRQGSSH